MKLLLCAEFFHPSVGGVQEVVRQLAIRMVEAGHDVTVATSFLATRESDSYRGIHIRSFDISGNQVNGMSGDVAIYQKFLLESDFNLLFVYAAQQWTFDALWEILPALQMRKVLVPCGYSGLMNPAYRGYFERLPSILGQFDALVYHAQDYRDYKFGQQHGLERVAVVIPNGADDREFSVMPDPGFRKRQEIPEHAITILTVGTLNGAKGHLEVASAFRKIDLKERSAVLLLNGNRMPNQPSSSTLGYRINRFIRYSRTNNPVRVAKTVARIILSLAGIKFGYFAELEKCLRHINKRSDRRVIQCDLNRDDLIQAYLAADLFVFASNIEYSPLVLYEACAAGLPFLSVSVGNAREISLWTSGGEVIDVDPDKEGMIKVSPERLAENIERLLIDHARLRALGKAGREAWQSRFNWEGLASEYLHLFQRLCTEGKHA